jgi:hypothetical protein
MMSQGLTLETVAEGAHSIQISKLLRKHVMPSMNKAGTLLACGIHIPNDSPLRQVWTDAQQKTICERLQVTAKGI